MAHRSRMIRALPAIVLALLLPAVVSGHSGDRSLDAGRPAAQRGVAVTAAAAGPALSVDVTADRHHISSGVYGTNFADTATARSVGYTWDRAGGNSMTRFDYLTDVHNTGSDYFFENIPPIFGDSFTDQGFIAGDRAVGLKTVMTVPLIGWTPKTPATTDHPFQCGFQVTRYGAQKATDPYDPNCGNGVRAQGGKVTGNDPHDTSTAIGPAFVGGWVRALVARDGRASEGGVQVYRLDNEPSLWNSTHRDVHPKPLTYDELRTRTIAYAAAVKDADPSAKTLGPGDWGWCAYLYSAADGCGPGADRTAHGGVDQAPWYLGQLRAASTAAGRRLLDYFDEHYYPQADGVSLSNAGDATTQALRLRTTRSLWDPTYKDESWISDTAPGGVAVRLIPRMRAWIAAGYPGTKLAITEYDFGGSESINGALAQADALGIFGREGVDLATLWGGPSATQPGAFAFRMFRDYDSANHRFGNVSVRALSFDSSQPGRPNGGQDRLSIYAAQRPGDGALTVVIVNKTGAALASPLGIAGFAPASTAQVWRYSEADLHHVIHEANAAVSDTTVSLSYPARSITLLVLPASAASEVVDAADRSVDAGGAASLRDRPRPS